MMVKSDLELFILKFTQPLQSCCCPVQKYVPRMAELAWQLSSYLILSKKMVISLLEILVHLLNEF